VTTTNQMGPRINVGSAEALVSSANISQFSDGFLDGESQLTSYNSTSLTGKVYTRDKT
jgi:hypothetical protein